MLLQNIFGYIRAKNYVKINVFKKGIQKCSEGLVSVVYLFTGISRFNAAFSLDLEKKSFINACSQRKICKEMWKRRLWIKSVHVSSQPRTQALWFVYVIKRTWEGTRGRKMENSARGSAW